MCGWFDAFDNSLNPSGSDSKSSAGSIVAVFGTAGTTTGGGASAASAGIAAIGKLPAGLANGLTNCELAGHLTNGVVRLAGFANVNFGGEGSIVFGAIVRSNSA